MSKQKDPPMIPVPVDEADKRTLIANPANPNGEQPRKVRKPDQEFQDLARIDRILSRHTPVAAARILGMLQGRNQERLTGGWTNDDVRAEAGA